MEHDDLLAAMYSDAEPTKVKAIEPANLRSRKLRVGIVEYEVPTVEYVRHLEQLVAQQAQAMAQMRREMTRLNAAFHGTRNVVRRQIDHVSDMRQELTRKVDLRQ